MFTQILILIAGLLLILLGANYLVEGSSNIARRSGISEFVIGLTIIGIGTSTPEMVVSFLSSFQGKSDMAIGNIVGSNIFNTMLILGVTALISPLKITRANLRRDILFGLNMTIFGIGTNTVSRMDGAILLLLFIGYLYMSFKKDAGNDESTEPARSYSTVLAIVMIAGGLASLVFGGRIFVNSATELARMSGVSDAFIAITVMSGGTSVPELATCVIAAIKGKGQLALGNILGSNISNILLIIGGSALINPLTVKGITPVDMGVMLLSAIFILASAYLFKKKRLDRVEGVILVAMDVAYIAYLVSTVLI